MAKHRGFLWGCKKAAFVPHFHPTLRPAKFKANKATRAHLERNDEVELLSRVLGGCELREIA